MTQFLPTRLLSGGSSTSTSSGGSRSPDGAGGVLPPLALQLPALRVPPPPPPLRHPPPPHQPHPLLSHVVRDQPAHVMHDYRYAPYLRHPALLAHAPADPQPSHALAQHAPPVDPARGFMAWHRQRRTRACQNCHLKKIKCEGEGAQCLSCARANIECRWAPMKKRGPKPRPKPPAAAAAAAESLPPTSTTTAAPSPLPAEAYDKRPALGLVHTGHAAQPSRTPSTATTISLTTASLTGSRYHSLSPASAGPAVPPPFDRLVRASEVGSGGPDLEPMDEVLRRFYSDEVPELTRNAVVYFFEYFYGICPIFHPATFVRRVVGGEVDPILLDSLRATVARLLNKHTGAGIDLDRLIEDVEARIISHLGEPTVDYVQAVVVMASLNGGECRFVMYNSLGCLASSLVTRLGWHTLDVCPLRPGASWREWVNTELKRRTFISVYQIDGYLSMVSDRAMTLPPGRIMTLPPAPLEGWDDVTVSRLPDQLRACFDPARTAAEVVRAASIVDPFVHLASLTTIMSRINDFLWKAKIALSAHAHGDRFKPAVRFLDRPALSLPRTGLPIKSLLDFDEFRRITEDLAEWRQCILDTMALTALASGDGHPFAKFGDRAHRTRLMRIRYFCMYTYSTPVLHCLHLTNRPSYFAAQSNGQVFERVPSTASLALTDAPENKLIYEILSCVFADRLNFGLLAYDVHEESWRICVESVYDLVRFLDDHADIPPERHDQAMPFCLLTSLTVLIRNSRICQHQLEEAGGKGSSTADAVRDDLAKTTAALRRLWALLRDLNDVWRISGVEYLLRMMQIEEVANAADLLSGMSL
ncbi:hypothetical protein H4R18_002669 [Coemansia javaensis]|uniref:Zn(2)-C6 fungal-type domain-containing protein n=1 Tax=Coemansia javaensis TaxID=2761396 RepID=A0A9W8LHD6_9FUNG|nr:hypothetical protein H4R18_002669 [Coemansia javaensis]